MYIFYLYHPIIIFSVSTNLTKSQLHFLAEFGDFHAVPAHFV